MHSAAIDAPRPVSQWHPNCSCTRTVGLRDMQLPFTREAFFDLFNVTNQQNVLERDGTRRFNNTGGLDDPGVTNNTNYLRVRTLSAARSGQLGLRWRF